MTTQQRGEAVDEIVVEGARGFYLTSQLDIVEEDKELAWEGAKAHIKLRDDIAWLRSHYVSADPAGNSNGHIFGLDQLVTEHQTVLNTPLNMGHRAQYTVGANVMSELFYPTSAAAPAGEGKEAAAGAPMAHPWVDTLSSFWRGVYRDEFARLQDANRAGASFISMECVPESLTCKTEGCCDRTYPYQGVQSSTYCDALNRPRAKKLLNRPFFVGSGVIIPPLRPGWRRADISQISALMKAHVEEADRIYAEVAAQSSHLSPQQWQAIMEDLLAGAYGDVPAMPERRLSPGMRRSAAPGRTYTPEVRRRLSPMGVTMPDGSFPVLTVKELERRITSFGRAKAENKPAVKEHLIRWAKALRRTDLLPRAWGVTAADEPPFDYDLEALNVGAFSAEHRARLVASNRAMADGSYPVETAEDLKAVVFLAVVDGRDAYGDDLALHAMYQAIALEEPELVPPAWGLSDAWDYALSWTDGDEFGDGPEIAVRYSAQRRRDLAKRRLAMPDGSYPIEDVAGLRRAVRAFGRASDPAAVKAWIVKRARALGATFLVPKAWSQAAAALVLDKIGRYFSPEDRARLAKEDKALPDGTWPIETLGDLDAAVVLYRFHQRPEIKAWIIRRARALAALDRLPSGWEAAPVKAADYSVGVIVCVEPPPAVAEALAALGGMAPDQIHLTLAYLGDDYDGTGALVDGPTSGELTAAVAAFAAGAPALERAVVSGLGRFALPDGTECTYASVDCPGLNELQARLLAALDAAAINVVRDHGFTPHLAVAFTAPGAGPTAMPQGLAFEIGSVSVWWAGAHTSFELTGGAVEFLEPPGPGAEAGAVAAYLAKLRDLACAYGLMRDAHLSRALQFVAELRGGGCCRCGAAPTAESLVSMIDLGACAGCAAEAGAQPFVDRKDDLYVPKPDDGRFDGVALRKDGEGFYVHTHRARSDSYPSLDLIPDSVIEFVRSTG